MYLFTSQQLSAVYIPTKSIKLINIMSFTFYRTLQNVRRIINWPNNALTNRQHIRIRMHYLDRFIEVQKNILLIYLDTNKIKLSLYQN